MLHKFITSLLAQKSHMLTDIYNNQTCFTQNKYINFAILSTYWSSSNKFHYQKQNDEHEPDTEHH